MSATKSWKVVGGDRGDRPWMVLVHGVSQDHRVFSAQVDAFRDRYRILLVDLPGHGMASDLPGPYGVSEYALHIRACMDAAGARGGVLWGTHLGASSGLLMAADHPGLVRTLVLESPVFPGRPLPAVAGLLSRVAATAKETGIEAARALWWEDGPWFDAIRDEPVTRRAEAHRRIVEDFAGAPWRDDGLVSRPLERIDERLAGLAAFAVIVNGERDVPDFLDAAEALGRALPACRRLVIPGAGGFPAWETPELVNRLVGEILEGGAVV